VVLLEPRTGGKLEGGDFSDANSKHWKSESSGHSFCCDMAIKKPAHRANGMKRSKLPVIDFRESAFDERDKSGKGGYAPTLGLAGESRNNIS